MPRSATSAQLPGFGRARIGLVGEDQLAGGVARPDRHRDGVHQRLQRVGLLDLPLMANQQIAELVADAAHVAQAQNRASTDRLSVGLDQAVGPCGQRHGSADAARPQCLDRVLDYARLRGFLRSQLLNTSTWSGAARVGHLAFGSPMSSGSSSVVDQAMTTCGSDWSSASARSASRPQQDRFVARGRLGLGQPAARAHQHDGGDDRKAENSKRQRQSGDLVLVKLRDRKHEVADGRHIDGLGGARGRHHPAETGGDGGKISAAPRMEPRHTLPPVIRIVSGIHACPIAAFRRRRATPARFRSHSKSLPGLRLHRRPSRPRIGRLYP